MVWGCRREPGGLWVPPGCLTQHRMGVKVTPKGPLWVSGAWAHSARGLSVCRITPSPLSSGGGVK